MLRYFFIIFGLVVILALFATGRRGHTFRKPPFELLPDMDHQEKVKFQVRSDFFADGMGSRKPVAGTLPMGYTIPTSASADSELPALSFTAGSDYLNTGLMGDFYGDGIPEAFTVDTAFLKRGQDRYDIYCAVCHGETGNGAGVTSQFGMQPKNLLLPEFQDSANVAYAPDGSLYQTIANGKGLMGSYGASLTIEDRWAVVAWVRALQKANPTVPTPAPVSPVDSANAAAEPAATATPAAE